jgi:hypothetical protein
MKPLHRFLIPVFVLAALALGAFGVAFARELTNSEYGSSATEEMEFTGVVDSIDGNTWTIDGHTVIVGLTTELKDIISLGQQVKVHAWMGADGSLTAREIELAGAAGVDSANSNDNVDDDLFDDDDNANDNVDDDLFDDDDNANDNVDDDLFDDDDNANDNEDDDSMDDNSNDNSDDDSDDDDNDDDSQDDDIEGDDASEDDDSDHDSGDDHDD